MRPLIDAALAALRAPLDAARFAAARDAFEYHILADLQTPSQIADNFGWYAVEGNLAYAPGANDATGPYFEAANAMTPASVAEVAKRYLAGPPVVENALARGEDQERSGDRHVRKVVAAAALATLIAASAAGSEPAALSGHGDAGDGRHARFDAGRSWTRC